MNNKELAEILKNAWIVATGRTKLREIIQENDRCNFCGKQNTKLTLFIGYRDVDLYCRALVCKDCFLTGMREQEVLHAKTIEIYQQTFALAYRLGERDALRELQLKVGLDKEKN